MSDEFYLPHHLEGHLSSSNRGPLGHKAGLPLPLDGPSLSRFQLPSSTRTARLWNYFHCSFSAMNVIYEMKTRQHLHRPLCVGFIQRYEKSAPPIEADELPLTQPTPSYVTCPWDIRSIPYWEVDVYVTCYINVLVAKIGGYRTRVVCCGGDWRRLIGMDQATLWGTYGPDIARRDACGFVVPCTRSAVWRKGRGSLVISKQT
jgi:hypothetical protein